MTGSSRDNSPLWAGDAERSVTAKLPAETHRLFVLLAKARGQTKGALARELIKEFVERQGMVSMR